MTDNSMTSHRAMVTSVTRRHCEIWTEESGFTLAQKASRHLSPCLGDLVFCRYAGQDLLIHDIVDRQNIMRRTFGRTSKVLATNVSWLFIVVAPGALFQTTLIDRILAVAQDARIKASLIVNKADTLSHDDSCLETIQYYKKITSDVFLMSALAGEGVEPFAHHLSSCISQDSLSCSKLIVLTGPSGVGKSTLVTHLIPEAQAKTATLSKKTGRGRQTTSQAKAYLLTARSNAIDDITEPAFLVDLPGIQNFGLTHLTEDRLRASFKDIHEISANCSYNNCSHLKEQGCAVVRSVEHEQLPKFRYDSYKDALYEIRRFADFERPGPDTL